MRRADWQGTAFVLWVLAAIAVVFLLRHPAGREIAAGPYGGALAAGVALTFYLGWTLGWTNRPRLVGLGLSAVVVVAAALLRLSPAWALGLDAPLLLPYLLGGALSGGTLPSLRVPELRLPRVSFPRTRRSAGGTSPGAPPAPDLPAVLAAQAGLPGWADTAEAAWAPAGELAMPAVEELPDDGVFAPYPDKLPAERPGRPAGEPEEEPPAEPGGVIPGRTEERLPGEEILLPAPVLAATAEAAAPGRKRPAARPGPARPARDEAVLLAEAALALLARAGVSAPVLHLESGPGGVALELALSSRRQGEAVSALRRAFEESLGAAPAESLHGQALRLTFPAHARSHQDADGRATLWAPLGRAAGGRRMLANLPGVGTLLLVGEDGAALVAAVHAIVGAALAGRLAPRPARVLLAEEAGNYLGVYAGLAEVYRGPECMAAIRDLAYERSRQGVGAPPALAVVLFPSPGLQAELAHFAAVLAPAGVHAVVALDTPRLWSARELAVLTPARLVFRVGEAESRFFLGRPGAEGLADGQAVYHLAETLREPQVLQAYAAGEEDVQELVTALRNAGPTVNPAKEAALATGAELPEKILVVLDAVLAVGRYSVRQVWDRVRAQGVSRQAVFELEDTFEAAGVVETPRNPLGRRRVLVGDREEAIARLRAYLEETR